MWRHKIWSMKFGDALRSHRTRLRLTRPDLAARSGVPAATIEKYEAGTEPTLGPAQRLADALGVTLDELLRDEAVAR